MINLLFILITFVLLGGFIGVTQYETRKGVRFFAERRARFDTNVRQFEFVMTHVDLLAFVRSEVERLMHYLGHQIVHLSLQAVRAAERLLTRMVRYFRTKSEYVQPPRETAREFVRTLSDFKDNLKATHPKIDVFEVK